MQIVVMYSVQEILLFYTEKGFNINFNTLFQMLGHTSCKITMEMCVLCVSSVFYISCSGWRILFCWQNYVYKHNYKDFMLFMFFMDFRLFRIFCCFWGNFRLMKTIKGYLESNYWTVEGSNFFLSVASLIFNNSGIAFKWALI